MFICWISKMVPWWLSMVPSFQRCGESSILQGADLEKTRKKKTWRGGNKLLHNKGCTSVVSVTLSIVNIVPQCSIYIIVIGKENIQTILKFHGKWHGNRCCFFHRWSSFQVGGYILIDRELENDYMGRCYMQQLQVSWGLRTLKASCWYHI